MHHSIDKKYFYLREQQKCYYCHKPLAMRQVTLDHYLPRSRGGTYDTFNLVCACRRCNQFKSSKIPADTEEVQLALLKLASADCRLTIAIPKLKPSELKSMISQATGLIRDSEETIVTGIFGRLWIKNNSVYRYERATAARLSAHTSTLTSALTFALLALILMLNSAFAQPLDNPLSPLISLESPYNYSARNLYQISEALVKRYPEWAKLITYGQSVDGKPLYAIALTAPGNDITSSKFKHFLFEAGTHSREVVNPVALLTIVEMYLRDIENPKVIPDTDVASLLKSNVLHFVPLSNPDGFNLAKFGLSGLSNSAVKQAFKQIGISPPRNRSNFPYLKSNARGVDLNRNYDDRFFKLATQQWISIWNQKHNQYVSSRPSSAFFPGVKPFSEPESAGLSLYLSKVPLSASISLHSRGEVIFWRYWMHDNNYNAVNYSLAKVLAKSTGYRLMDGDSEYSSSGYLGDWIANTFYVPHITLETTSYKIPYDTTSSKVYKDTVDLLLPVPAQVMRWSASQPTPKYWLYVDNRFVRSYSSSIVALAYAKVYGGEIWSNYHRPIALSGSLGKMTRPDTPPAEIGRAHV